MMVGSQHTALLQGDRHASPVLPALAAGEPSSAQSLAQLLQVEEKLYVLGLVGGVLVLDLGEEISHSLQLQLGLGRCVGPHTVERCLRDSCDVMYRRCLH